MANFCQSKCLKFYSMVIYSKKGFTRGSSFQHLLQKNFEFRDHRLEGRDVPIRGVDPERREDDARVEDVALRRDDGELAPAFEAWKVGGERPMEADSQVMFTIQRYMQPLRRLDPSSSGSGKKCDRMGDLFRLGLLLNVIGARNFFDPNSVLLVTGALMMPKVVNKLTLVAQRVYLFGNLRITVTLTGSNLWVDYRDRVQWRSSLGCLLQTLGI